MGKTMCELGKKKRASRLEEESRYECRKCEETANKKDWVCKPKKI